MSSVCFNRECSKSNVEHCRPGWRLSSGDFVQLCAPCASAYEQGKFCDIFHLSHSGWRRCESCEKPIHCIASALDDGGICLACAKVTLEPTPEVKLESAAEIKLEPAAEVKLEPAAEVTLEPTPEVTLEPAAANFPDIPHLVELIMMNLPADCVKSFLGDTEWGPTIRGSFFQKHFLSASRKRLIRQLAVFLVLKKQDTSLLFSVSADEDRGSFHISRKTGYPSSHSPSVHGLFCIGPDRLASSNLLEVYNPGTKQSITLPSIGSQRRSTNRYIGYDNHEHVYRILLLMKKKERAEDGWVFTIGKDTDWRRIVKMPDHFPQGEGVCVGDCVFYLARGGLLARFNMNEEIIQILEGPPAANVGFLTTYHGFCSICDVNGNNMVIWMLQDTWVKKTFELPYSDLHVHQFMEDSGFIFAPKKVHSVPLEIVFHDAENNKEIRKQINKIPGRSWEITVFPQKVESLLFV